MLCYVVLCCVAVWCVGLRFAFCLFCVDVRVSCFVLCAFLRHVVSCCVVLCCIVLYCVVLCCVVLCCVCVLLFRMCCVVFRDFVSSVRASCFVLGCGM